MPRTGKISARDVACYGLLIALAFVLSYIENLLPLSLGVPGVKLGLANLVSITAMYLIGLRGAAFVSLVRILLTGLTFGNPSLMLYSLAGGALSLGVMALLKRTGLFSMTGVSIGGGAAHNIGQLLVAAWIGRTWGVFSYLPVLLAAGTAAGAAIGLAGAMLVRRLKKWQVFQEN